MIAVLGEQHGDLPMADLPMSIAPITNNSFLP